MVTIQEKFDQEYEKNIQTIWFNGDEKLLGSELKLCEFTQLKFICIKDLSQLKHLEIQDCPELELIECPSCEMKIDNSPKVKTIKSSSIEPDKPTFIINQDKKGIDWPCLVAVITSIVSLTIAIYFANKTAKRNK